MINWFRDKKRSWGILIFGIVLVQSQFARAAGSEVLIFGRGGDSVGLDPARVTDGESFNVTDHIFDTLVTFAAGSTEVVPNLAERWEISQDGLKYKFFLRKNVKFHDGQAFNAEAVVFSFMRQKDNKHPAYSYGSPYVYFGSLGLETLIKSINAIDEHTVEFHLTRPEAPFLSSLGMQAFAIVSPQALLKYKQDFARNPVGTGPFRFKSWSKNQKIDLEANPEYWGEKPSLKKIIFRSIPDNSTRLLEMMSGRIHVMDNPNPDDINTLKQKMGKKINFASQPGLNVAYLAMNNQKKPFDNIKVRQAIAFAINKKAIIDAVYAGQAQVAVNPMPPTLWGYHDKIIDRKLDLDKAKALLKEAGFPNGFETTIWAMPVPRPYMPDGRKVAEAIQGDLAKIGIIAKIVSYEWGTYLDKTQRGEHDMALMGWTGDIGDPDNFLYVLLDKDNATAPAQNISFYKSEKLHKLLLDAKVNGDRNARIKLYKEAQQVIFDDVPMIPLAHSLDVVPLLPQVKNFVIEPTGRRRFAQVRLEKE